jgi:hypothetical protein
MMDLFNGLVQKMKDDGGVTLAIDSQENGEASTTKKRDNEEGDEDEGE